MLDSFGLVSEGSGETFSWCAMASCSRRRSAPEFCTAYPRLSDSDCAQTWTSKSSNSPIPREMLYIADELFLYGTAAEITPIRSVDRIPIGTVSQAR